MALVDGARGLLDVAHHAAADPAAALRRRRPGSAPRVSRASPGHLPDHGDDLGGARDRAPRRAAAAERSCPPSRGRSPGRRTVRRVPGTCAPSGPESRSTAVTARMSSAESSGAEPEPPTIHLEDHVGPDPPGRARSARRARDRNPVTRASTLGDRSIAADRAPGGRRRGERIERQDRARSHPSAPAGRPLGVSATGIRLLDPDHQRPGHPPSDLRRPHARQRANARQLQRRGSSKTLAVGRELERTRMIVAALKIV